MKFRKKPVVIEAVQWTGENMREVYDFLTGTSDDHLHPEGTHFYIDHMKGKGGLVIKTKEGELLASINDWIIKGIHGEFYPCKPDIFESTYEKVED